MPTFTGTLGNDFLVGSPDADTLIGLAGNDRIFGLEGDDSLEGNEDSDSLNGNQGEDTVRGGAGDDWVRGGRGNDLLWSDAGNDFLHGDRGNDTALGGEGDDLLFGDEPFAGIGNDVLYGEAGNDTLFGLAGNDQLFGGDGDDILMGNQGQDTLDGDDGNDVIFGGRDDDVLFGNAGNDLIHGDLGADTVTGGEGNDIFVIGRRFDVPGFRTTGGPTPADADWITDFKPGQDVIALIGTLTFEDLNFFNVNAGNTMIQDKGTGEFLAILQGINASDIKGIDFFPPGNTTNPGILSFTTANYSDNEGNSDTPNKIVATIQRTDGSDGIVTVQVQLGEGSTATPNDFTNNLPITVTFNPGDTSKTVALPILGDTIPEGNDTINLKLVNPTGGASLGTQQTATYTIVNDDIATAPEIEVLDGATNIADGTTTAINFGVTTVNSAATKTFTVKNTGTADLILSAINLPDGFSLVGNLPSSIVAGNSATFQVQLNANATGTFNGTLQFTNNDSDENPFDFPISGTVEPPPTVSITATDAEAAETGNNTGTFRLTRTGNAAGALTVNLAIDASSTVTSNAGGGFPVDYNFSVSGGASISGTGATRTLIIPAGQSFVDLTVTPENDEHAEADETLKLNLASGSYAIDGTNNNGTVTFSANDTVVINTNDSVDNYALREGSLRQAMLNAEAFTGDNTITFSGAATSGTINLTGVLPNITQNLNINGPGASNLTVRRDTGGDYRIFRVNSGDVTFDGLTIANGLLSDEAVDDMGGGIANFGNGTVNVNNSIVSNNRVVFGAGGGIGDFGKGTINVNNSTVSNNQVETGFGGGIFSNDNGRVIVTNSTFSGNKAMGGGSGGGIHSEPGTLTVVTDSSFSNNEASFSGGGISALNGAAITNSTFSENKAGNFGGAIAYAGTLTLTNSIISNNQAFIGGGINGTGNATIIDSTVTNNVAREDGGGISIRGNVTIDNSTVANNTAGRNAGGIYNDSSGTVNFTHSTLSGNAARGVGGGIFNRLGTINSDRSTIANNTADSDRNNTGIGGGVANEGGTVNAKNTIVAGNIDGLNIVGTDSTDFAGSLTSQGYNLIGNTTGTTIIGTTTGNILNIAANLGALQNNGGSTQTMALLANSPAINAGDPNFTPPPDTDQRGTGFNRVNGGRLDIGAFESDFALTAQMLQLSNPNLMGTAFL